ncbi:MAG: hypothetical protein NTW66_02765 [Candidatus Magasanikbacteria bacterium]|nr:hypothetical protein [Candidatus Magasanikbacteria bacterium]
MRKYIIIFIIFSAMALIATGCAVKNSANQKNGNAEPNASQGEMNASGTERMNFGTPASIQDLAIGKKITVMGTTNSDGTISATRIMIGEMPGFGQGMRSSTDHFATGTMPGQNNDGQQDLQPPQGEGQMPSGGDAPQGEQFQRRSAGGQWGGQNGTGGQRMGRTPGQSRLSGEIMKLDETSIVLQITDNGSKIVFYSQKTEIFNVPTSTPPMPPRITSTTVSGSQP